VPEESQVELGKVCVAYLSFNDFETQISKYVDKATTRSMATLERLVDTESLLPPLEDQPRKSYGGFVVNMLLRRLILLATS